MTHHTPLTAQQLDDIDTRQQAATKGPWGVYESGSLIEIAADLEDTGCGYRARREIARLEDEPLDNDPAHREWTAEEDWAQVQADAAFIAHAPDDVRALLAEVRSLRTKLDQRTEALASADNPTQLRWGLNDVLWGDDDTVTVLLSGPDREPYWLELDPERAAVLREDLAGPDGEQTTEEETSGTRPCGHDDYHDAHEWADRPGTWCAGHSHAAAAGVESRNTR